MSIISEINIDTAPENIKKIVADHVAEGHTITAEKRTLLHNAAAGDIVLTLGSGDVYKQTKLFLQ